MYIELTEKRILSGKISGLTLHGLEIESEWNGLTKLVHPDTGVYLIVMREEGLIVDGTPSVIDQLLAPIAPRAESGYINIPGRTITIGKYSIDVAPFSVAQYMNCVDADGKAYVSETETPRVKINFAKSKAACELAGGGMIRGSQHLAIAMDIMSVAEKWSGGKVGEGILRRGLHRGTVSGAQPNNYVSPHADENRWFVLPDGQRICDFAGHLYTYMIDDIHGTPDGLTGKIPADSPYLKIASEFSQAQGMGYRPDGARDWSGHALIRGSCWNSGDGSGVFYLSIGWPDRGYDVVGVRCTKSLG